MYMDNCQAVIGTADTRTPRACEGACSISDMSVKYIDFCFRAGLARTCKRSNPRVDFYSTHSRIAIVNCLNF